MRTVLHLEPPFVHFAYPDNFQIKKIAVKVASIYESKHPISLYIYDTPGELELIKQEAVIFPTVDLILVILNGDQDEHLDPEMIGKYNHFIAQNLAKYTGKVTSLAGNDHFHVNNNDHLCTMTPLAAAREKAAKGERVSHKNNDESVFTPLHYMTTLNNDFGNQNAKNCIEESPRIVYVFTNRDKVEEKGIVNVELVAKQREKLVKAGVVTKNMYIVSSKIYSDVHVMFKNELLELSKKGSN